MHRIVFSLIASLFAAIISRPVLAWGPVAHEAICEIAYQELTPAARAKVNALIKRDPEYRLFSKSCNWMDHPRKRAVEHYVNVARNMNKIEDRPCPTADKCVVSAILNDMRDLALTSDEEEQLVLLKSLGHWLGDIHQPLHVSFEDDQGGNKIGIESTCKSNLHAVWDNCIVERKIGEDPKAIALRLRAEISPENRAAWASSNIDAQSVIGWANESLAITLKPDTAYCIQKDDACWYAPDRKEFSLGQPMRNVIADDAYLTKQAPIVSERIKMAGIRLGSMLNTIFAPAVSETAPVSPLPPAASPSADRVTVSAEDVRHLSEKIDRLEQAIASLREEIAKLRESGALQRR